MPVALNIAKYCKLRRWSCHSCVRARGFTLIELSIVLVIIGLVVGGVMVGLDLVRAAQVKASTSQIEEYSTALNVYKFKYNALPGDHKDAYALGLTQDADGNYITCTFNGGFPTWRYGNGNRRLDDGNHSSVVYHNYEFSFFWGHLRGAGLINDISGTYASNEICHSTLQAGIDYPVAKGVGETVAAVTHEGTLYFILGGFLKQRANNGMSHAAIGGPNTLAQLQLTPDDARRVDEKMDDGKPLGGNVFAITDYAAVLPGASTGMFTRDTASGSSGCVAASGEYNLASTQKECTLAIRSQ